MTAPLDHSAPLGARRCAFCRKGLGCFAFVRSVIESLGGEPGNGYAHPACLSRAKRKAEKSLRRPDCG